MKKLHFTLGENFGKLLTDTAIEKAYYDLDLHGAKKFIKDSLPGIPDNLVNDILLFRKVGVTAGDYQVDVIDKKEEHHSYLSVDPIDFYYKNYKRLNETARDYYSQLSYFIKNMQRNDVVCEWVSDEILIHRDDLINQAFTSENEESFLKGIKRQSFREVKASMPEKFFLLVSDIKKLLKESSGYIVLFDFLYTEYTQEIDNVNDTYGYRGNVPSDVLSLHGYVNLIQSGQIESIVLESDKSDNLLIKYLESQKGIEKISKKGIEQAEILDGYDAGYLSQDGVFYGMRGTIANMLHLEIANEMYKKGLIPIKYKDEIDLFFEENGWAKIHGNRVLYAGYDLHTSGLTVIPMSLKQQKIIADYIEKLHDGIMEVNGFETITALKFKSTEQPMLRNYFSQIHI